MIKYALCCAEFGQIHIKKHSTRFVGLYEKCRNCKQMIHIDEYWGERILSSLYHNIYFIYRIPVAGYVGEFI